jgi:hypothetical protein
MKASLSILSFIWWAAMGAMQILAIIIHHAMTLDDITIMISLATCAIMCKLEADK